jgi:colanic acid/amylovoran biosynthesis glycosyltransferase
MTRSSKPVVAHSVSSWLPLTMTWAYNQVKYMSKYQSIVLTTFMQNTEHFPWEPIYSFGNRTEKFLFRCKKKLRLASYPPFFDKAVTLYKPKIFHSHFGEQGWYDLPLARKHAMKHVVSFYGYDVNMLPVQQPVWNERYKRLFDRADLFLCEGPHMAACLNGLGCPPEKVRVQRLGIEVERIPFTPRRVGKDGVVRILIAGTFREKKGIPDALEAIGILRERYPAVEVTVVGDATGQVREITEKQRILDTIKRLGLEQVTTLLGFQPSQKLMEEAYRHHIFLSPSLTADDGDTEGGAPVTIIEMAASGMPVFSTRHCDIPFVLGEKNRALLVPERHSEALATKMLAMLQSTHGHWDEIAKDNRSFIERELDVFNCVTRLEALYASLH